MTEAERIENMVTAGRLNRAEADDILATLADLEGAEASLDSIQEELRPDVGKPNIGKSDIGKPDIGEPDIGEPGLGEFEMGEPNAAASKIISAAQQNAGVTYWVHVELLAGDIDIRADDHLSEPKLLSGKARIEREGADFWVRPVVTSYKSRGDGFLDRVGEMAAKFASRVGDLELRVPADCGVHVRSKAGDIDISGVAFIKGEFMAGDVDVSNVGGFDINATAGDISVDTIVTSGQHSIRAAAGEVNLRLRAGSSAAVTGRVSMGEASVNRRDGGSFESVRGGAGENVNLSVGAGAAAVDVALSTGSLEVDVDG